MSTPKEIIEVEQKVENAVAEVSKVTIKSDEDLAGAATLLTNVTKLGKFVDQEKEKIIKPMRESMSAARALFAPLEEKIESAQKKLKSAMATYHDKVEKEKEEKKEKIAANVESGHFKEETGLRKMEEVGDAKKNVKVEAGQVSMKKIKKVRFAALETLKPDEIAYLIKGKFVVWDEVLARKAALAGFLGTGVEIYEETSVATNV